jgi:subtilisin
MRIGTREIAMNNWNGKAAIDGASAGGGSLSEAPQDVGRKTGRMIVTFRDAESATSAYGVMSAAAGVKVIGSAGDYYGNQKPSAFDFETLGESECFMLPEIGVAIMGPVAADQSARLASSATAGDSAILAVEQEEIKGILTDHVFSGDYLSGIRTGVNTLLDRLIEDGQFPNESRRADRRAPRGNGNAANTATWGLVATKAAKSPYTGKGVRVAVLDTGFDAAHDDFKGRTIVAQSFISGESAQDGHGHGTHCIGTACGPRNAEQATGYGIAPGAEIYVGKVLSNGGSGGDAGILAGIDWAVRNGCAVISMSLGARARSREPYNQSYAAAAREALKKNSVIVAAAGNDGFDSGYVVAKPANSPGIYAVAAVDEAMAPARFSNISAGAFGGEIDVAGPGVGVYSSWKLPERYKTINGTSMATPHVAGVLALLAEAFPSRRGGALIELIQEFTLRLDASSRRVGLGIIQAPA